MFCVCQPEPPRLARYWLSGGAPAPPAKEKGELKVSCSPEEEAWKSPPPKSVAGGGIEPPPLSTGETSSQARPSSRLKALVGAWVVKAETSLSSSPAELVTTRR